MKQKYSTRAIGIFIGSLLGIWLATIFISPAGAQWPLIGWWQIDNDKGATDGQVMEWDVPTAAWIPGTSGGGGAPTDAEYVTLSTDATLTDERVLTAGDGIGLADAGAGSTITVTGDGKVLYSAGDASSDRGFLADKVSAGEGIDLATEVGPPQKLNIAAEDATETNKGILEIATDAEMIAGTATDKALVPSNLPLTTGGDLMFWLGGTGYERLPLGNEKDVLVVDTAALFPLTWVPDLSYTQTWNIVNEYTVMASGVPAATSDFDVSNALEDFGLIGGTVTMAATSTYSFTNNHISANYGTWTLNYWHDGLSLLEATRLAIYDSFERKTGYVTVLCRFKINDVSLMADCRIGYCDAVSSTNTQSTVFNPTADGVWEEVTHVSSSIDGYGNNLDWFVEFIPQSSGETINKAITIDVEFVSITHTRT